MSRLARRPRADHKHTAEEARHRPGTWVTVGEYRNATSARDVANRIRSGCPLGTPAYGTPYEPAGAFESRTRLTEDGTLLEVRFTGGTLLSDQRRVQQTSDTQRVLGQIERGEIRCGADAAREIAARHETAYGSAVWPGSDDEAWADALASLDGGTV
ncbi:hypothetical protein [Streptomyces purpurascens]|uniref:hypothetical protein n=1 Tax=Streptomyces purpurascens TaxID=1924 RepID=UPI0016758479|nr:hypothetical protein [Streptomyces purpurascens]MCE7049509.1 hypothetical protein [Streptomyces purpurascens]GHA22198.1 hypothetical protein GCM10010303_35880 [Streptomyces purpurascens]